MRRRCLAVGKLRCDGLGMTTLVIGIIVSVTLGCNLRGWWLDKRPKYDSAAPSIRTGKMVAPVLPATKPGPS